MLHSFGRIDFDIMFLKFPLLPGVNHHEHMYWCHYDLYIFLPMSKLTSVAPLIIQGPKGCVDIGGEG